MSLFPAYSSEVSRHIPIDDTSPTEVKHDTPRDVTEFSETQLLASDDDEEQRCASPVKPRQREERERSPLRCNDDFYLDTKLDPGNLWVSTLYYPGRPQYVSSVAGEGRAKKSRVRRYFELSAAAADDAADAADAAQRAAAYRRALADQPHDVHLWMQFIHFQERCSGAAAALRAAAEACSAAPRARALRQLRLDLARRHLPADHHLAELRDLIADASCPALKLELWARLLSALAGSAGACSAASLAAAARAALRDVRAPPTAYPRLLYVYGAFLRSGGLWEQLVLLLELALGMSLPPAPGFPAPPDPHADRAEEELLAAEECAVGSGMPLSAVWVRVERARAARHWRADAAAAAAAADPQRAPRPADVADLLQPLAEPRALFLLLVTALRLAKVPLLPGAGWLRRAAEGAAAGALAGAGWAAHGGEALLPLLRAARRLPPAHAARRVCARALAHHLQPPHYFSDTGFLTWVESLWEAALGWSSGRRREALLCWRLRWLHSLMLLLDGQEASGRAELARLRGRARASLKQYAGSQALPFAVFARLELCAADRSAALRVALRTMRAVSRDQEAAAATRLYCARVLRELSAPGAAPAAWALCCAALARALPPDAALQHAPPPDLAALALRTCEERCSEIESSFSSHDDDEEEACAALLPGEAEWACARALLAAPARRAELVRALRAAGDRTTDAGARELRWCEQSACALTVAASEHARLLDTARDLAPLFPDNAFLNIAAEGGGARPRAAARGDAAALARALPALLAAPPQAWTPQEAERAARVLGRAAALGAGGVLLWAARLEAAARAPRPAPARLLYQALDAAPHSKVSAHSQLLWAARLEAAARAPRPAPARLLYQALDAAPHSKVSAHSQLLWAARLEAAARAPRPAPARLLYQALDAAPHSKVSAHSQLLWAARLEAAARAPRPAPARLLYQALDAAPHSKVSAHSQLLWAARLEAAARAPRPAPARLLYQALDAAPHSKVSAHSQLLWAARLEAAARAPRPAPARLLYQALDAAPHSKVSAHSQLLWAARLEAAARAPRPAPARLLYQALDAAPHSKWLHVAGAQWVGGEARALADALLDKQLRLHALPDELQPLPPPPPALHTDTTQ